MTTRHMNLQSILFLNHEIQGLLFMYEGKRYLYHYENKSMQYTAIFHAYKNNNFQMKNCDILLLLLKTEIVGTR